MTNLLSPEHNPLRVKTSASLQPFPYVGLVKRNDDLQHMGRLSVWIPEIGGQPTDEGSWIICSYMSPFAGATDINKIKNYSSDPQVAQQSYGWVGVPPDLNTEVMVVFVGGQLSRAYWIGCTYQQNMNSMVPGIPVNSTTETKTPPPVSPTLEYNKSNMKGDVNFPLRPPFIALTNGLTQEGLDIDTERGQSTSSMRRESPPLVYGYLTPRGNNVYVDDNVLNEFIRLRTRSGAQILIHETSGYVYINSKSGNSWFEISDKGIDAYSLGTISMRSEDDFNIRSDKNINIDAGSNVNIRAASSITMIAGADIQAGAAAAMKLSSGADTTSAAGGSWKRQGNTILDNCGGVGNASGPKPKQVLDTKEVNNDGSWSWKYGARTINTIVSRMPTHEPWKLHPNSNVPGPPIKMIDTTRTGNGVGPNTVPPKTTGPGGGCSFGAAGTKPITTDVYNSITAAADKTGADPATMLAFADMESSFQPGAKAGTSSATGLFQFTSGTWAGMVNNYGSKYNVGPGDINDPNANALMGGQFIQDNKAALQRAGIASPTPGQLYTAHFMGASGATKLINANNTDPNADASSLFPQQAAANPTIFQGKTVGQVYSRLTSTADTKAQAYANQYGLAAPCQRGNGTGGNSPSVPSTPPGTPGSPLPSSGPGVQVIHIDPANPEGSVAPYLGKAYPSAKTGKTECVSLLQTGFGFPSTSTWQQGINVLNAQSAGTLVPGTAIATFNQQGVYTNTYGQSHAAIYIAPATDGSGGIRVLEQYNKVGKTILTNYPPNSPRGGEHSASNYSIINLPGRH